MNTLEAIKQMQSQSHKHVGFELFRSVLPQSIADNDKERRNLLRSIKAALGIPPGSYLSVWEKELPGMLVAAIARMEAA
jgi:hypothetical protein